MTSCCQQRQMLWNEATGAIARCKRVSTACGRKRRSVRVWRWICGVKPKPKAVNKPSPHCIVHGLDKPGGFTTVSILPKFADYPQHLHALRAARRGLSRGECTDRRVAPDPRGRRESTCDTSESRWSGRA